MIQNRFFKIFHRLYNPESLLFLASWPWLVFTSKSKYSHSKTTMPDTLQENSNELKTSKPYEPFYHQDSIIHVYFSDFGLAVGLTLKSNNSHSNTTIFTLFTRRSSSNDSEKDSCAVCVQPDRVWSESTDSWCAEDVSEREPRRSDSANTDKSRFDYRLLQFLCKNRILSSYGFI